MLYADYGEGYAGARQPAIAKVDPLSRRTPDGMLVYRTGAPKHAPKLPAQYAPVQVTTTAVPREPSATMNAGTVRTIKTKSTTVPSSYKQSVTIPTAKPAPSATLSTASRPAPSYGTAPSQVPTAPAPSPSAPSPGSAGGRPRAPSAPTPQVINFPDDMYTKVGTILAPQRSSLWWIVGGLGVAAIAGGAYLMMRKS